MEDCYIRDVQPNDVIEGKVFKPWFACAKCKEILPRNDFIYRLSRAQAKAQGYAGNVMVDAVSTLCRACRPRRKLSDLTARELRTKVEFGELHSATAEAMIERRNAKALAKQTRAARMRWDEVTKGEWMIHIKAVGEEIRAVTYQHKHARKCGNHARMTFFTYYLTELNKLRDLLRGERRRAEARPMETHWVGCLDTEKRREIVEAWQALPIEDRVMLRMPEVVNNGRQEQEQGSNRQRLFTHRGISADMKERLNAINRNRIHNSRTEKSATYQPPEGESNG